MAPISKESMMGSSIFRPVAEPRIIENTFTDDQHRRLLDVARGNGPHPLILAQYFTSADEVYGTMWDKVPEGEATWDMFLTPVFRGFLAKGGAAFYPEIEDCFLNTKFLQLVREYWGAQYARPEEMYFNLQGPCPGGDTAHVDATHFRGISMNNSPTWLMNVMAKSGLFTRWQAKKGQVITWWYKGRVGGGFTYWPDGPDEAPRQIRAPMWGRGVVVEAEMTYHTAEATGPSALRRPAGLALDTVLNSEEQGDAWQLTTKGKVIQRIPAEEMRLLIHWSADIFMDYQELKISLDQSDDLSHDQVFDIFISDLKSRGESFATPSNPLADPDFVRLLSRVYDPGIPSIYPPEPDETAVAA
jgi:hypothetical protein